MKGDMRMKKIISIILSLCIAISLCACGNDTSNDKENNEMKSTYDEINLGSTIETEFADVSFIDIKISNTIKNTTPNIDLKDESDKVYFVLYGEVANTGTDSLALSVYADVLIDDTYTYSMRMELEETAPLVPLDSEKFLLYASLPDEVFNACENYSLKIGFNENFHTVKTEIEECEYKFEINGAVDEFGSAESVEDFQSLIEYIKTLLGNSDYNNLSMESDSSIDFIYINSNNSSVVTHNGETYAFTPELILSPTYIDRQITPMLLLKVTINGDSESAHYMYIENLKIESDSGVYEHDNTKKNFYDTETQGKNSWGTYTSCHITSNDTLEQLVTVLNGNNLTISFDAVPTDGEVESLQFECDNAVKESMIDLCNIFKDIIDKDFYIK